MKKFKNRKKLTALTLAFMLTFLVATAFAFQPGALDIEGTANVTPPPELYVVWSNPTAAPMVMTMHPYITGTVGTPQLVDRNEPGDTRSDQIIRWTVDFEWDEPNPGSGNAPIETFSAGTWIPPMLMPNATTGLAFLTSQVRNNSLDTYAILSGTTINWYVVAYDNGDRVRTPGTESNAGALGLTLVPHVNTYLVPAVGTGETLAPQEEVNFIRLELRWNPAAITVSGDGPFSIDFEVGFTYEPVVTP